MICWHSGYLDGLPDCYTSQDLDGRCSAQVRRLPALRLAGHPGLHGAPAQAGPAAARGAARRRRERRRGGAAHAQADPAAAVGLVGDAVPRLHQVPDASPDPGCRCRPFRLLRGRSTCNPGGASSVRCWQDVCAALCMAILRLVLPALQPDLHRRHGPRGVGHLAAGHGGHRPDARLRGGLQDRRGA